MSVLFPTLQKLWGLSYGNLGLISTIRNLLQALSAPFWGFISDKMSRKMVILFGTGIWGLWTAAVGLTQNFGQLLVIRAISGIGLGCLMPATFSIMSDTFPPKDRGKASVCWKRPVSLASSLPLLVWAPGNTGPLALGILPVGRFQRHLGCGSLVLCERTDPR